MLIRTSMLGCIQSPDAGVGDVSAVFSFIYVYGSNDHVLQGQTGNVQYVHVLCFV